MSSTPGRSAAESQQQLRGQRPPGSGGEAQPQAPDHPGLEITPGGERHVGCGHGRARTLEEQLAGLRQLDATGVALEQLNAELGFEPAHLGREPWLGDPQPLGGAGEASLLGDRDEIAKMAEFHVALPMRPSALASAAISAAAASSASSAAT